MGGEGKSGNANALSAQEAMQQLNKLIEELDNSISDRISKREGVSGSLANPEAAAEDDQHRTAAEIAADAFTSIYTKNTAVYEFISMQKTLATMQALNAKTLKQAQDPKISGFSQLQIQQLRQLNPLLDAAYKPAQQRLMLAIQENWEQAAEGFTAFQEKYGDQLGVQNNALLTELITGTKMASAYIKTQSDRLPGIQM